MSEEIWDNTKLQAYACEMRGHYAMERHLQSREPSEALAFGIAFHKAVEVWTNQLLLKNDAITHAKDAFLECWERERPLELREKLELENNRRSYANFCRLFEAFTRKFPIEMYDQIVATETPFTLHLGQSPRGRSINWSGILDRAVIWQGGLYYVDIKTSSYPLDDRFFSQFRLSGQMTGYAWAGQQLGLGNFNGIMIQAIEVKVPLTEVKLKKDGTPYARQARAVDDLIGVDIIPISDEMIERWKASTLRKIDQIMEAREMGFYTQNFGELCNSYTGCPYRMLCDAPSELVEQRIEEHYRVREWKPLERDS